MKTHSKSINPLVYFGIGLTALAIASSPVSAASSQAKRKTPQARHKAAQTAQVKDAAPPPAFAPAPPAPSLAPVATPAPVERDYSFSEAASQSVLGDVYSNPSDWQALGFHDFFTRGWDKPWVSPPAGGGGAPRQGWINTYDGVFYRLSIATFAWQHGLANNSDGYTGTLTSYTPLNQRLEIRTDLSLASNRGPTGRSDAQTNFGDFILTPRFLLSESKEQSQTFEVALRTPTGNSFNGNGYASISPTYEFWTNYWKGLVVRGGVGFSVPYSGEIAKAGARSTFNANMALGYYFTPHNAAPFGDLVFYVANNLVQAIDNRGPSSTTAFSIGPGFRSHLGDNWYLLGTVDFPVTKPQAYDYQVYSGIMKVY
jgi:hypothetical protein